MSTLDAIVTESSGIVRKHAYNQDKSKNHAIDQEKKF